MATVTKTYIPFSYNYNKSDYDGASSYSPPTALKGPDVASGDIQYAAYLGVVTGGTDTKRHFYYNFNINDIPHGATNISVSCSVRIRNAQTRISTATVQLYAGDTAKGTATSFAGVTANTKYNLNCGSWTVDELKTAELCIINSMTSTTSAQTYTWFYGAELSVTYTEPLSRSIGCGTNSRAAVFAGIERPTFTGYHGYSDISYTLPTGRSDWREIRDVSYSSADTNYVYFKANTNDLTKVTLSPGGDITDVLDQYKQTGITKTTVLHPIAFTLSTEPISGASNGCDSTTSTTYSEMHWSGSTTSRSIDAYYLFDTSEIPRNAIIESVECFAKGCKYNNSTYARVALYSNRSMKGTSVNFSNGIVTTFNLRCGSTWSREALDRLEIRLFGSGSTGTYLFRFYGADLVLKYTVPGNYYKVPLPNANVSETGLALAVRSDVKIDSSWKTLAGAYRKVNDAWEPIPNLETELQDKVLVGDKYLEMPFTIEMKQDGEISWPLRSKTVQYSKNNGEWATMTSATSISVANGDIVRFKGTNGEYSGNTLSCTGNFEVYGNIMSLIYGDDFVNEKELVSANTFCGLFSGDTKLVSAKNLRLPATNLTRNCYAYMFYGCSSLTSVPELPATTLADYCYYHMFNGCGSLMTAPELPATTLANFCYQYMFNGCRSLTTAPELPATTLANYCYNSMFSQCSSLTTAPALPATALRTSCYANMFYNCTSLTTAPSLPATTLFGDCYSSMFSECTSLTTAPTLPATTLYSSCYRYMFQGCTNLKYAPALPASTLANYCYDSMFAGCTSLTNAPVLPATTLAAYCYQDMFSGCTSLTYIKAMFTTTPSTSYTRNWVSGVAASGTFVKNVSATWTETGVNGVPTGWTTRTENQ